MITKTWERITVLNGKEYHETVTKQIGVQQIPFEGEMITVGEVTITESKLGRSVVFTRDPRGVYLEPEVAEECKRVAVQALIDQGIW